MALAFDSVAGLATASGTTLTWNHTCTGTNLILLAYFTTANGQTPSAVTYNGVAMTLITKNPSSGTSPLYTYYLVNPATGTHAVTITWPLSDPDSNGISASYTGASQSGQPDAFHNTDTGGATATTLSNSVTTIANNCWTVGFWYADGAVTFTAGAGTLRKTQSAGGANGCIDSNGPKTPAGSSTLTANIGSLQRMGATIVSIAPVGVASGAPLFNLL